MTTLTSPRLRHRPVVTRQALAIGFAVTIAVGLVLAAGMSLAVGMLSADRALPGVHVGNVSVAGLTRAEAEAALNQELASLSSGRALVTADGDVYEVTYAELGRRYDTTAMLDDAFAVGRDGNLLADAVAHLRSLVEPVSLPLLVHAYDPDALAEAASRISRGASTYAREASISHDGTRLTLHASTDGRQLRAADVEAALGAALDSTDPADVALELPVTVVRPIVDTDMARDAMLAAQGMMHDLALTTADADELALTADQISSWISFGPQGSDDYVARLDHAALAAAVSGLAEEIDRDPASARITVAAGGGVGGVVPGIDGRTLVVADAINALTETLAGRAAGASVPTLELPVTYSPPALTTERAQEILPQMRLVSSWTTNYVVNDGNGFGANISIGAWDLDGYNIAPGEWFSFWNGIGPVTLERGYKYGGAIINGRSVPNGALAGGICSTSTTLFNAAMRFGLEIGERENHYYYIDRYPTGLDATVAIVNDQVTDMTFRNDTDNPIVIRGFGTPGRVTFQLWSVPNGRSVVLGAPVITNRHAAIETTQLVSTMAPGSAQRVEFPHAGFDATVTRTVYAADGSVIHQNTWFSDYRPVNGITLVGPPRPAAPSPSTPPPPTPPPTPSPSPSPPPEPTPAP